MKEKTDIPIFRISSVLLFLFSFAALCCAVSSNEAILSFFKNPFVSTTESLFNFIQFLALWGLGGPLFAGFGICGLLGFRWRFQMEKAKICFSIGSFMLLLQIVTIVFLAPYFRQSSMIFVELGIPSFISYILLLAPFLLGIILLIAYILGAIKMNGRLPRPGAPDGDGIGSP